MDINTCYELTKDIHTIAYYSHLVPVGISLILAIFVLISTKFSLLSRVFGLFTGSFCLWLLGDVILWTQQDYNLVSFIWSQLDYINVLFYILGAYFFALLIKGNDVPLWQKLSLFSLSLPAWFITFTNHSIEEFYQPVCEALNSSDLTNYKLVVELVCLAFILGDGIYWFIKSNWQKRKQIASVASALVLFFSVFSVTEYIASTTGNYEINLYGLFVLPLFLLLIIYSITNQKAFELRLIGSQLSAYILIILVGSQFFFLEDTSDKLLTLITFGFSLALGILLIRNARKEARQREQIEKQEKALEEANAHLTELDRLKSEFVSLATHQIRAPLTAIKGYISEIFEGDFGEVPKGLEEPLNTVMRSNENLINIVGDFLNISRIEQGRMTYEFSSFDLAQIAKEVGSEIKPNIDRANLAFSIEVEPNHNYSVSADIGKTKQIIGNLIDNAIKYTKQGWIKLAVSKNNVNGMIRVTISDSGVGVTAETMPKLFQKFSRAGDANKTNVIGTGLGLYVVKTMVEAQHGKVWVESEGAGKGSTFIVEFPAVHVS